MAHKKVHPAETHSPQTPDDNPVSPPGAPPDSNPFRDRLQEQDPKRQQGAFEGKGEHARQQEIGNKD